MTVFGADAHTVDATTLQPTMLSAASANAAAPNIVVIYADDLGYGDISAFGSPDVRTPHLDGLAARGIRLTNWYSNSPVCSPSRASLLTGKYPTRAGVEEILGGHRGMHGMPAQVTMADRLKSAGYRTGIFGKWHLGTDEGQRPADRGFDEQYGFLAGCVDYYSHIFYWAENRNPIHDLWRDGEHVFDNGRYLTEVIAEEASAFIERSANAPFFCYVPFNAPHYPMHAPKEYVDRFPDLPGDRRIIAAMISAMDDGIGRIVDALDAAGVRENTIVFFSSDNGPSAESRNWLDGEEISYTGGSAGGLRGHKGSVFEGGIRVPSIVSWPAGLPSGVDFDTPAAMMDLLPTLLEAVGADAVVEAGADGADLEHLAQAHADATELDGTSQLSGWRGAAGDAPRALFWEYEGQAAARNGQWKLVRHPIEKLGDDNVHGEQLYNLAADAAESTDLAVQEPHVRAELSSALDAWLREMAALRMERRGEHVH